MKKTRVKIKRGQEPEHAVGPGAEQETVAAGPGATEPKELPSELDGLRARVEKLEEALLRAKADYQNLQRRSANERAEAVLYGNAELMKSVLTVADDFERALEAAKSTDNHDAVVEGVQLVYENLMQSLGRSGLEPIAALHHPFDPAVHEAMLRQPTDEHPPGTVVQELVKGYRLHDRVVRPSKVVVAAPPTDE